jgi:predicted metal-dependent enzyme (double-stranded beta helix superfamily)
MYSRSPLATDAPTSARTLSELAELVTARVAQPAAWMARVRLCLGERWYERLESGPDHDVWIISWLPGQATGMHDHGSSSGAFGVALGALEERPIGAEPRDVVFGQVCAFGPRYVHDVRNASMAPAISIHVYSPPLVEMNTYEMAGSELVSAGITWEDR